MISDDDRKRFFLWCGEQPGKKTIMARIHEYLTANQMTLSKDDVARLRNATYTKLYRDGHIDGIDYQRRPAAEPPPVYSSEETSEARDLTTLSSLDGYEFPATMRYIADAINEMKRPTVPKAAQRAVARALESNHIEVQFAKVRYEAEKRVNEADRRANEAERRASKLIEDRKPSK